MDRLGIQNVCTTVIDIEIQLFVQVKARICKTFPKLQLTQFNTLLVLEPLYHIGNA